MHYEVYVDLIFLINFMMDGILLLLTAGILKCRITWGRLVLAAGVGALVGVLMTVIYLPNFWLKSMLAYLCGGAGMIFCAFPVRSFRFFAKAFMVLMICTFLMGGILQSVSRSVRSVGIFFLFAGMAYRFGNWMVKFLEMRLVRRQGIYEIELYTGEKCFVVRGKMDTGNSLKDTCSQKPVHVMAKKKAEELFGEELRRENKNFYRIPYSTVQGEGEMPVLEIEKMYLQPVGDGRSRKTGKLAESGRWMKHPVIGICQIPVFEQEEYDILLNPEGLGGVES